MNITVAIVDITSYVIAQASANSPVPSCNLTEEEPPAAIAPPPDTAAEVEAEQEVPAAGEQTTELKENRAPVKLKMSNEPAAAAPLNNDSHQCRL